ncbi:MAG TPA: antitoxin VbhA family protein [Rickettsia endosymbiont of Omalisus fontisbellaquei]|nr:antitoxin VbhA family protein [Rickettsia endosymbiont of Omalisus fontisbellaquei]
MKFTEEEVKQRLENLQDSIANQKLEGLEVDRATIKDMQQHAHGNITIDEVIKNIHKRLEDGKI